MKLFFCLVDGIGFAAVSISLGLAYLFSMSLVGCLWALRMIARRTIKPLGRYVRRRGILKIGKVTKGKTEWLSVEIAGIRILLANRATQNVLGKQVKKEVDSPLLPAEESRTEEDSPERVKIQ